MKLAALAAAALLAGAAVSGCFLFKPAKAPIDRIEYGAGDHDTLFVFLPGRFSEPEEFAEAGFIKMVRERNIPADMIAVDAHLNYYRKQNLLPRLHEDIVIPARERGYENVWIVGISMGCVGTLLYTEAHTDAVTGLFIMAPFLGDEDVVEEVRTAGGLAVWNPPGVAAEEDWQRFQLAFLHRYSQSGNGLPPLYLGWGTEDDVSIDNDLLADALGPDRVFTVPGGHDWDAWSKLWAQFLDARFMDR